MTKEKLFVTSDCCFQDMEGSGKSDKLTGPGVRGPQVSATAGTWRFRHFFTSDYEKDCSAECALNVMQVLG